MRHARAADVGDQDGQRAAAPAHSTPRRLAAVTTGRRGNGSPHTCVPWSGIAAHGRLASDRSGPLYRLTPVLRASRLRRHTRTGRRGGVGADVDAPPGQLGGQAGVLPLLADGEGELVVG